MSSSTSFPWPTYPNSTVNAFQDFHFPPSLRHPGPSMKRPAPARCHLCLERSGLLTLETYYWEVHLALIHKPDFMATIFATHKDNILFSTYLVPLPDFSIGSKPSGAREGVDYRARSMIWHHYFRIYATKPGWISPLPIEKEDSFCKSILLANTVVV